MFRDTLWPLVFFAATIGNGFASQADCDDFHGVRLDEEICQCGSELKNLEIDAPKGMVLRAVCGLTELSTSGSRPIDLKKERVSLEKHAAEGYYYWGSFYFSGTKVLRGIVRIEASDAGFLWFHPELPFESYDHVLKLDREIPRKIFGMPAYMGDPRWFTCARAEATIRLHAIEVNLSDQDGAGTYAIGVEVLSHSKFQNVDC